MNKKYLNILAIIPFLTSCSDYKTNHFNIKIYNYEINETFYKKEDNNINLDLFRDYYIDINIPKKEWEMNKMSNKVKVEYDSSKINVRFDSEDYYDHRIIYYIQPLEIFNDEEITISYNNSKYKINLNSSFDVSSSKIKKDVFDKYPSFKKMIDSISYYTYQNNYPGIIEYSENRGLYDVHDAFYEEDYKGYFNYFKDDCYYPKIFEDALGEYSNRNLYMYFDKKCDISKNSPKSPMIGFEISKNNGDPEGLLIYFMKFEAINKNYVSESSKANEFIYNELNEENYLLYKRYKNEFLSYKVNDIELTLFKNNGVIYKDVVYGYFEDNTYVYKVSYYDSYYSRS